MAVEKKYPSQFRRYHWRKSDERVVIDNFHMTVTELMELLPFTEEAIRRTKNMILKQAKAGILKPEQCENVLSAAGEIDAEKPKKLPALDVGATYKIETAPIGGVRGSIRRKGKVLGYYPKGRFWLVDFGCYKESISQSELMDPDVHFSRGR